jgi:hypothetical protein
VRSTAHRRDRAASAHRLAGIARGRASRRRSARPDPRVHARPRGAAAGTVPVR